MAENPFQGMLNPNMNRGASMWDMRMMAAANRSEAPFERGIGRSYPGRGRGGSLLSGMSGVANEPDYSAFTYDPAMRQQAIDAGVTPLEASQVRSNAILPNTGFFKNHPHLAGAIEGGLFAGANAHGGNTVGESIQGALEGVIGGQRERQGILREQFARPFEAANMLEGLRDKQQKRELQSADIEHLRSLNEHLKSGDYEKAQKDSETNRHNEAMEAMGFQKADAGDRRVSETNRHDEAMEALRGQQKQAGAGPWYSVTKNGQTTYGRLHEGATTPEGAKLIQGDFQSKQDIKTSDHRQAWIQNQLGKPGPVWMSAGVSPGDPDATKKLGKFYDDNIATGMQQQSPGGAVPTYDPESGTLK
jgi:hypothetical protein